MPNAYLPSHNVLPYGNWPSEITSERIVEESVRLGQVRTDGDAVYWLEGRPSEKGRGVIMRCGADGAREALTPDGFSVRTRAHEYGGADFFVHHGTLYFSNDDDQRMYRQDPGGDPRPLTPAGGWRYADGVFDAARNRILCVVEDHTVAGAEPRTSIAIVQPDGEAPPVPLLEGNDFYSNPCVSPDGDRLAWLTWSHPDMPWDGAELWVADVDAEGVLTNRTRVAGSRDESVFQPQWSPDGILYFVSDRNNWWNLYRFRGGDVEEVVIGAFETGLPQWVFGMSTYGFLSAERLVVAINELGIWHMADVDVAQGTVARIPLPHSDIDSVLPLDDGFAFRGGSPREPSTIVRYRFRTGRAQVIRRSASAQLDADTLSCAQHITYPTTGETLAHAFYYAPTHPDCSGPDDEQPPLIVKSHGGPTACTGTALDLRIQYWTSRGFAVLDVNYRGSTGFGRAYRRALDGGWGVLDVDDCVAGANHLAGLGRADGNRMIITGSSAGGYTTLAALTFRDVFRAGASYYGISDLEALVRDTHKFEARYTDRLVGAYPREKSMYEERSPIHFPERLSCPVIFFQGLRDKVVPPNQAEVMVEALKARGLPVAYVTFAEEGHGFREADNIKRALDAELYFYARVFGLELADEPDPVEIANLREDFLY